MALLIVTVVVSTIGCVVIEFDLWTDLIPGVVLISLFSVAVVLFILMRMSEPPRQIIGSFPNNSRPSEEERDT